MEHMDVVMEELVLVQEDADVLKAGKVSSVRQILTNVNTLTNTVVPMNVKTHRAVFIADAQQDINCLQILELVQILMNVGHTQIHAVLDQHVLIRWEVTVVTATLDLVQAVEKIAKILMNAKHIMDAKTNVATRMAATNANVPMVILEIMDEPVKMSMNVNLVMVANTNV